LKTSYKSVYISEMPVFARLNFFMVHLIESLLHVKMYSFFFLVQDTEFRLEMVCSRDVPNFFTFDQSMLFEGGY
jgi:hypothetical protein